MPRYFFDIEYGAGEFIAPDEIGTELDGSEPMRRAAYMLLSELMLDALPDGAEETIRVIVRDETGKVRFRARCRFAVEEYHPD